MENVDRCVCCGSVIPEGVMVCGACINKYSDAHKESHNCEEFFKKFLNIKLKWYQKIWLKLYEVSIKIPRKGSYRYFRTKGGS